MKKTIFFDVDTQKEFMQKNRKLYVPGAELIIPNLKRITQFAAERKIPIIASIDLCNSDKLSENHEKIPETSVKNFVAIPHFDLGEEVGSKINGQSLLVIKKSHSPFSNPNLSRILKKFNKAYVYGVATDFCVKATVLGLRDMEIETYVITDAIKPVYGENEQKNLHLFEKNGAKFVTTEELIGKK